MSVLARLSLRLFIGLLFMIVVIFFTAGTFRFWLGWAFVAAFFLPGALGSLYLYKHDPRLIERRLQRKESLPEQRSLVRFMKPAFFLAYFVPGLDYHFGWTRHLFGAVPLWLSVIALLGVCAGVLLVIRVMRVNSYASRTIRVEDQQPVISTGPYHWVRHPMYSGSLLMWLCMPLSMGSYVGFFLYALLFPFYVVRLLKEEKFLRVNLPGYSEYCAHTRYHLIPAIW